MTETSLGCAGITVTVVVPNRDHAQFLPQCLSAIAEQRRPADEVLIIDDGSVDDSVAVIQSFLPRFAAARLLRHRQPQGIAAALNEGLAEAHGSHVLFAAADDWILPGLLLQTVPLLQRYPAAGFCSTISLTSDAAGGRLRPFPTAVPLRRPGYIPPALARNLLIRDEGWMMGNTTVLNRSAALLAGGFRASLHSFCDMFLYQVLALRHGACFVPLTLGVWRRRSDSLSAASLVSPQRMLDILAATKELMTGDFADLFAAAHVSRWERRWRFAAARGIASVPAEERSDFCAALSGDTGHGSATLRALAGVPHLGATLATTYLFLRLRAADLYPMLRRRLMWLFAGDRFTELSKSPP